jgi:hypothetical protein
VDREDIKAQGLVGLPTNLDSPGLVLGDIRTQVFLRRPPRSVRHIAAPLGSSVAASGNTNSTD